MDKLVLTYKGLDSWSRPVFESQEGKLFKDTNCNSGTLALCTVCGGFEGEPDTPIEYTKYHEIKIELVDFEPRVTEQERYNYMLLSRLKSDCDYYLGYGYRCKTHLWAKNEIEQIEEMKKLYNWFDNDKKPEWLTWDQILEYEKQMVG